jgi:tetratricopeptide (TPR) repeat protein
VTHLTHLLHHADQHYQQGQVEQAIDLYCQVLALEEAPPEVNLRLGQLYEEQGRVEEAARCFRIVADSFRDGPVKLAALRQLAELEPRQVYSRAAELMMLAERRDAHGQVVLMLEKLACLMPTNQALQQELRRLRGDAGQSPTLLDLATVVEFRPARPTRPGRPVLLPSVEGDPAPPLAATPPKKWADSGRSPNK